MSDGIKSNLNEQNRLPVALMLAALVSMWGIFITDGNRFLGLPLIALLLLGTWATTRRISPVDRWSRWGLRIAMLTGILGVIGVPKGDVHLWYMQPQFTNAIGILLSAELMLRAWIRPEPGKWRTSCGMILFLSAIIMTAASNTYDRQPMHTMIPVYMLLLALSLRAMVKVGQPAKRPAAWRRAMVGLLALRGGAMLLAMSLGFGVVFALTRYENRLTSWAMDFLRQDRAVKGSAIGLNSAPHLRRIFNPAPSMERVLLVQGTSTEQHLKVMAFDAYENREWGPNIGRRTFNAATAKQLNSGETGERWKILPLSEAFEMLAVPSQASAILASGALEVDGLGSVREREGAGSAYEVIAPRAEDLVPLEGWPDAAERKRALLVPESIDPKVIALAREVTGNGDAASRVNHIAQYLQSHHEYSLSYDPGTDEPLNDFLLNRRAAHCQYFASAVVVMARVAGVPARMVTGYYASEQFGDKQLVVRDRDAHAWAECFIDGKGWVTVDATPSSGRPDAVFGKASKVREWWEWFTDLPGRLRQWMEKVPRQAMLVLIAVIAAVMLVVLVIRIWRKRRRVKVVATGGYPRPSEELIAAGRRFERWLLRRNVACAENRTWREHVAGLLGQSPPVIDVKSLQFVEAYDRARFGGAAEMLPQIQTTLDQLEQSAAQPGSEQHG